jgi:outer membrane protein TolC
MNIEKRRNGLFLSWAVLLMTWTLLAGTGNTGTSKVLSLNECIALALENNPRPASQSYDMDAAKARVQEKKGNLLPTISGNGSYTRFSNNALPGGENQAYGFTVRVSQPLFQGGGLTASVDNAEADWEASGYRYESVVQDMILEVNDAYFNYLKNKRLLEVAERALTQAEIYLEAARERFRLGAARPADTLKAEVEVSDAELNVIKAQNALLTARGRLNKVLGLRVTESTEVQDLLEEERIIDNRPEVDALMNEAEKRLPELKEMDMNIRARKAALKAAKSTYWPSISAGASYEWTGSTVPNLEGNWNVGLSLDIPIFNGFSRKAAVAQQRARLRMLNKQKEELRQNVSLAVWVDFLKVKETRERITNSKKHLKNARENLRIAEGEYKEGVSSMLELIDARTTFVSAERSYINVMAEFRIARARLERSIGIIEK